MRYLKSLAFLVLLLSCSMYSYWLTNRDYQWIVPHISERAPAAVRESKDVDKIVERPMRVFKREMIASTIEIKQPKDEQIFVIGPFSVPAPGGENLVCLEYPLMKVTFKGEGAALAGRQAQVHVLGACRVDPSNKNSIMGMPLPFNEFSRMPAENQQYDMDYSDSKYEISIENIVGDWPRLWYLEKVEFLKDKSSEVEDKIVISSDEIRRKTGGPISVK